MPPTINHVQLDKSYIDAAVQYYTALRDNFTSVRDRKFLHPYNQSRLRLEARDIVWKNVYQAYPDPGTRTEDLLDSMAAGAVTEDNAAQLVVFSDPLIAAAKLNPGLSYAAFFEAPVELSSFIKPLGTAAPSNYRPFFDILTHNVDGMTLEMAKQATEETIQELQPQILK